MTRAGLHPGLINLNTTFSQPKAVLHLACALPREKEKGFTIWDSTLQSDILMKAE
jgi:hypothetical protein